LGSEVHESEAGNQLSGKTGFTAFSFGENVEASIEADGDGTGATVRSSQRFKMALLSKGPRVAHESSSSTAQKLCSPDARDGRGVRSLCPPSSPGGLP